MATITSTTVTQGTTALASQYNSVVTDLNAINAESSALAPIKWDGIPSGLNFTFSSGSVFNQTSRVAVTGGTIALTNTATNFVEVNSAGTVSSNTTGFTTGRVPLYVVVTSGGTYTSGTVYDARVWTVLMPMVADRIKTSGADVVFSATAPGGSGYVPLTTSAVAVSWQQLTLATAGFRAALLSDTKAQNTAAQSLPSNTWNTRELTQEDSDPDNIVSLSANQFTLQAGTYLIRWSCPAYDTDTSTHDHKSRLQNTTDATTVNFGTTCTADGVGGADTTRVVTHSMGWGLTTIAGAKAFAIQHATANTTSGGKAMNNSNAGSEVYTIVEIIKVG